MTKGRLLTAAVAVGAASVAAQHIAPQGGGSLAPNQAAPMEYLGMGGDAPAPGVLPLPEISSSARDTLREEVTSLAKGRHAADHRAEDAAAANQDATGRAATATSGIGQLPGAVVAPTTGVITSNYGPRWGTTHYGLDIANGIGTPVVSVRDGEVIDSGPASGFGLWVRIRHDDGTITVYGHINETLVSEGQRVTTGEQIATVGNRGQSTGPHLHFEVHLGGERKTDPLDWLQHNGIPSDGDFL